MSPFAKGKLKLEDAGGDQFKRLGRPRAVLKFERPELPDHARHYDSLTEASQPERTLFRRPLATGEHHSGARGRDLGGSDLDELDAEAG